MAEIRARVQPPGLAAIRAPERRNFVHKRILGFAAKKLAGFVPGGQIALDIGGAVRNALKSSKRGIAIPPIPLVGPAPPAPIGVAPQVALPPRPGAPAAAPAARALEVQGEAVVGAFDMPAIVPLEVARVTLDCPRGMVLGMDDLCYPSAVLRRNSKFRKWRSSPRPAISRKDERCLARVDAVQKTIKTLGKKAGLKVTG